MHTASLYTYTGSYGIDTVVVALDSHLGTLTRHAGNAANGDQTILNLRNLGLQHALQEQRTGTRKNDAGIVVLVLYLLDDSTNGLTLVIVVGRNLLCLRQVQFITLIIDEQHLTLPHLVNLSRNYLSDLVLILIIQGVVLQFQNLRSQSLTQVQNGTTAKLLEVHLLRNFLANLVVGLNLLSL